MSSQAIKNLAELLRRAQGRIDKETGEDIDIGDLVQDLRREYDNLLAENERLEIVISRKVSALHSSREYCGELKAENERLHQALKRIAPTACPRCGDRSIQQIARDALREG